MRSISFIKINQNLPPAFLGLLNLVYWKNIKELMSQEDGEAFGHQAEVMIPKDGWATACHAALVVHFFILTHCWWREIMARNIKGIQKDTLYIPIIHSTFLSLALSVLCDPWFSQLLLNSYQPEFQALLPQVLHCFNKYQLHLLTISIRNAASKLS